MDTRIKKIAYMGLMTGIALVLSYIEFLIPIPLGIPGLKLGLPNLAVLLLLYLYGPKEAFTVNILRIVLSAFLFSGISAMLYSLVGGICSFLVMWILVKYKCFQMIGVSVAGSVIHNTSQCLLAMIILSTGNLIYYMPILWITGTVTGILIGFICKLTIPVLKKITK